MTPRATAGGVLVALVATFLLSPPSTAASLPELDLPAEVLTDLSPSEEAALATLVAPEGETLTVLTEADGVLEATLLQVDDGTASDAVALLDDQPSVEVVSVAQDVGLLGDPFRPVQWPLDTLRAEEVRTLLPGTRPVVAVLDTGVDGGHEDLDGVLVPGYDAVGATGGTTDENGHGTHVAGTIAAEVDNSVGVAGLLSDVAIMPVRVMQGETGNTALTTQGVLWAANNGADVINLSLGGPGHDPALESAVDYADSKGVVVVAAMGNGALTGNAVSYPAAYGNVLAVGATDRNGVRGDFSSTGPHIDVAAPGVFVASTYPRTSTEPRGSYQYMSGTSMASPHAAAVAAAVSVRYPSLTPSQVRTHIKDTATDKGATGPDAFYGTGVVNPYAALTTAPAVLVGAVPSVPPGVTASPAAASAGVSWSAPGSTGTGGAVTGYQITLTPAAGAVRTVSTDASARTTTVTGLLNGTRYSVGVRAVNSTGPGATATSEVTPRTVPSTVGGLSATPGPASLHASWAVPNNGGSVITGYVLTLTPPAGTPVTVDTTATSHTVTGLVNGTSYQVTVRARNAAGLGATSASVASTPYGAAGLTGDEAFVRALYLDMLGREPSIGEIRGWAAEYRVRGPQHVVNGFAGSREYRIKSIDAAYVDVLNRTADPVGREGWYQAVLLGQVSIDDIRPSFLASAEFYAQGGNTDAGWITLLYMRSLGRPADAGAISHWRGVLAREGRTSVILGIYNSTESAGQRVDRAYRTWLGRTAGPNERLYWTETVIRGGDEVMRQSVMVSAEYYNRAAGR